MYPTFDFTGQYTLNIYVSDEIIPNGGSKNLLEHHTVNMACQYLTGDTAIFDRPNFYESDSHTNQDLDAVEDPNPVFSFLNYTIPTSEATGRHTYVCGYEEFAQTRVQVTLIYVGEPE